ncbi:MAG: MFS transporter [candidate division Zixibacteria bacterium]|nr:MFS transporter [candidate division Zixibacteria bacterium]
MSSPPPSSSETPGLSRLQTARGIRLWNLNGALDAVHAAVTTGAYTTGYALHLGASTAMIGFISAAPSLGQILQAFSPLLIERLRRRKMLCVIAAGLSYLLWLPVAFLPFLVPEPLRMMALVGCIALSGAAMALALPAQSSWLSDLVPGAIRGRFVARQQSILAGVGLVTTLAAGAFMDRFSEMEQQTGFTLLFVLAVVFALGAAWAWNRIPEPSRPLAPSAPATQLLSLPFRHPQFRKLMLLVSGRLFMAQIAAPFFTVYMLLILEMSYTEIAIFSGLQTLANIALNPLWGYFADKFGYRPTFLMTALGLAFYPFSWIFITPDNYLYLVPIAQIWGGAVSGGIPVAQFNLMIKTAPETNRSVYIGAYTALSRLAIVLGAPVGGALATLCATFPEVRTLGFSFSGLQYLFAIGFVLRLSWVVLLTRVSDETAMPAREVLGQMRSGNPVTTLWHLMRMGGSTDADERAQAARELGNTGSPLAVDELVKLLGDAERTVRREAVRSLGHIRDERAISPLIESIGDPASDVAEEAVEALGAIPSPLSLNVLVTLLSDHNPSIRKSAVLALGRIRDSHAQEAISRLLETEPDPQVVLAAVESLSRIGDPQITPRLREMMRRSHPGIERKTLAHAFSHLMRTSDTYYRLQQSDAIGQDQTIVRIFKTARRRINDGRGFSPVEKRETSARMETALRAFEAERYEDTLKAVCEIAEAVVRRVSEQDEEIRMICGFLTGLKEEMQTRPLLFEEFLLGMAAFQKLTDHA